MCTNSLQLNATRGTSLLKTRYVKEGQPYSNRLKKKKKKKEEKNSQSKTLIQNTLLMFAFLFFYFFKRSKLKFIIKDFVLKYSVDFSNKKVGFFFLKRSKLKFIIKDVLKCSVDISIRFFFFF